MTTPGLRELEPVARPQGGFRLHTVEVRNWGTFHRHVWRLDVDGGNALLTGQVGAGKSTLVDGLSIVMNAPQRVSFNLAAGADRRERSLRSYVLGAHRNIADELSGGSRPDYLRRPDGTLSAVLATFASAQGLHVTAGVLLRFASQDSAPVWEYLLADRRVTIAADLTGHKDMTALRSALKASGVTTFRVFEEYQKQLCRRLGLTPAALALFNQTVSMKSVGNLTEFVRSYMLDGPSLVTDIAAMLAHYANLTRAHDTVVDARRQVETLTAVRTESRRLDEVDQRIDAADGALRDVPALVDELRVGLLRDEIDALGRRLPVREGELHDLDERTARLTERRQDYDRRLQKVGGASLEPARLAVEGAKERLAVTTQRAGRLRQLSDEAEITPPGSGPDGFAAFRSRLAGALAALDREVTAATTEQGRAVVVRQQAEKDLADLDRELRTAATRDSNVPAPESDLRDRIAEAAGIDPADLPYAAELMRVAEGQSGWEGALERLVRPFALSLLVADEHYPAVSTWVDEHHLGRRLVYLRVPAEIGPRRAGQSASPDSAAAKIDLRPHRRFSSWLGDELARRYDHRCVATAGELASHHRAVTRNGQVRDGARHEKDDRQHVGDRRHFVLGWDTVGRRRALTEARPALQAAMDDAEGALRTALDRSAGLRSRQRAADQLQGEFTDPRAVDVPAAERALELAGSHYARLTADPELAALTRECTALDEQVAALRHQRDTVVGLIATDRKALTEHRAALAHIERGRAERATTPPDAANEDSTEAERSMAALREQTLAAAVEAVGVRPGRLDECADYERVLNDRLGLSLTALRGSRSKASNALITAQQAYATRWPAACSDIATHDETGRHDLLRVLARLADDDLPQFERKFREQLENNAINEIAVFSRNLETSSRSIAARIQTINAALATIDYRPGTYIALTVEPSKDQFVREFRQQLRDITQDTVGGDDPYSEERFLRVRDLLDRFQGRKDTSEEDARWTRRVTDVRNWHAFAASERDREEDTLVEHYTDSDGKSGGQKEKLAYTVLAASLAYQYGIAEGSETAFRFVMIDEAFGRGSDESTRFALELFGRLGLQLLVVTPLQKIRTIEPYVQAVGYVAQEDQQHSKLISMTVQEFRERQRRHQASRAAGPDGDVAAAAPEGAA